MRDLIAKKIAHILKTFGAHLARDRLNLHFVYFEYTIFSISCI